MKNYFEIRGDAAAIFLNKRNGEIFETLVDAEDIEKLMKYTGTWIAHHNRIKIYVEGALNGKVTSLHRFITNCPDGFVVDHVNGNTLDNRKENLRILTIAENNQNRSGAQVNSKSGIRGVCWHKQNKKWRAQIKLNGIKIHIGYFKDIKEAENAVSEARKNTMKYSMN